MVVDWPFQEFLTISKFGKFEIEYMNLCFPSSSLSLSLSLLSSITLKQAFVASPSHISPMKFLILHTWDICLSMQLGNALIFTFSCIIQFDWCSKVSNVLNVSKLIVFFLLCILDMKPLFLIFVCWIGNALNFWPFTWIKKLRCWKIVKFETYFTCLWQVNEAVVSGWLFFRYLVIGGSTHSLFTFITTLVFAGLWPLFLVESCSFFFTLFVSDFLFFPLF